MPKWKSEPRLNERIHPTTDQSNENINNNMSVSYESVRYHGNQPEQQETFKVIIF